jgi:hypothetical protein
VAEKMQDYEYFMVFQTYQLLAAIKDINYELHDTNLKLDRIIELLKELKK